MDTPVVFVIFNRPHQTERVFAEIAKAKPPKLLVIADGPRPGVTGEAEKCAAVREVISGVDWNCEVIKNYSDINLGCGRRVASGLNWAFDSVEEAIVLEDDTLPHPTFFRFCEELLEKYRHDERVMHISGNNYVGGLSDSYSYFFSRYDHIWGWASWRRAWRYYDFTMSEWRVLKETSWLVDILCDGAAAAWWDNYFDQISLGMIDTWDCQWVFSLWAQNGLSVTPNVNLVTNLGFGADSTHTSQRSPLASLPIEEMVFPLRHPLYMVRNREADRLAFELACRSRVRQPVPSFLGRVQRKLSSLVS